MAVVKAESSSDAKEAAKSKEGRTWHVKKGKATLYTPCSEKHEWKQWTEYVKHCKKFRCDREGCGFFKKCWTACEAVSYTHLTLPTICSV